MSRIYSDHHRALQDKFETRKMADRLEDLIVRTEVTDDDKAFVESRDMFFLSTVDPDGQPTVSYKGGDPGLVKVVDPRTIAFPSYDGNGMFYSTGNLSSHAPIGMLFIDFETPHRLRLHGEASIQLDDPLTSQFLEAELVVRVKVSNIWTNCPRYIHRLKKLETSRYVPQENCDTPLAEWKRVDLMQDVLPPKDVGRPEKAGGIITIEEWIDNVRKGKG